MKYKDFEKLMESRHGNKKKKLPKKFFEEELGIKYVGENEWGF